MCCCVPHTVSRVCLSLFVLTHGCFGSIVHSILVLLLSSKMKDILNGIWHHVLPPSFSPDPHVFNTECILRNPLGLYQEQSPSLTCRCLSNSEFLAMGPDFVDHIGPFDHRKVMKNCFETESEENRLDLGHQVYSHIFG